MRSRWLRLFAAAAVIGLAGVPATRGQTSSPTKVSMKEFAYMPDTVTVMAGTTVTWTYDESATDPVPNCESPQFQSPSPVTCPGHSVTAVDKGPDGKALFDSGVHRADGFPFSYTFTAPGTYKYFCTVHGGPNPNNPLTHMDGTVIVTGAPASGSGSGSPGAAGTSPSTAGRATLPVTGGRSLALFGVLLVLAGVALSAGTRRASRAVPPRGSGPSS